MRDWLPENFTPPAGRASEIAKIVVKRGKARKRNEKIALSFCSFLFVAVFSLMTVQNFHETAPVQNSITTYDGTNRDNKAVTELAIAQDPAEAILEAPVPGQKPAHTSPTAAKSISSDTINFEKVDHSVAISWEGQGKFAVYKCDSPKFDSCSIMQVVEGNSYLDKEENSGKIVYYRIEPLERKG